MQTSVLDLNINGKQLFVTVERKNMKNIRLKVYPEASVKLSAPYTVSDEYLMEYVLKKQQWIEDRLKEFFLTKGYAATTVIKNGMSIKMLGEDLIFALSKCGKNSVYREGKILHVCCNDISDQDNIIKFFDKWWREKSLIIIRQYVDELYPIVQKYGVSYPDIYIRKMKTLWGSCSVDKNKITFNQYLTKAKPACIKYVVLHELVHFLYPNHSRRFYDFLGSYMPDWKEIKQILDNDVVHGL